MFKVIKFIFGSVLFFILFSLFLVGVYKYINPPLSPLMFIRSIETLENDYNSGFEHSWASYENISPHLFRAVIAAEDARFKVHKGIDWKAVDNAQRYNKIHKGKKVRGASTITMQTAKNTFLWNGRNYIRKGLEVYFTYLIDYVWGKERVLEVYANIIEWGDGVYGVEAASLKYFNKNAVNLTKREASILAAVLPNPRRWNPSKPTKYILKRSAWVRNRMGGISLNFDKIKKK